jgi:tetratricopeptide (TPR) repeat protein
VYFAVAEHPPSPRTRTIAGRAAVGVLALIPVVAVIALATAPGGIDGQVSKAWDQLTDPNAKTPANTPDRLTATSSVRARYWKEALDVHATSPWIGGGAGAYGTLRTRFRTDALAVRHAHGYVVQTLADLGWAGLAASLLAAIAWLAAAARATGIHRRARGLPWDAERVGMVTLAIVVIVFGIHSAVDWTWFVPANAGVAMLCAGWVVGRGPLRARLAHPAGAAPPPPAWPYTSRLARIGNSVPPLHGVGAALVLVLALAAAWTAFQPVRAVHASDQAYARLDRGQPAAAADIARIATRRDPLSADPLFDLAAIDQAQGDLKGAQGSLEKAVRLEPATAETWRRLGDFRLTALHDPKSAVSAYQAAYYLDPHNPVSTTDLLTASRAEQGSTGAAPTP